MGKRRQSTNGTAQEITHLNRVVRLEMSDYANHLRHAIWARTSGTFIGRTFARALLLILNRPVGWVTLSYKLIQIGDLSEFGKRKLLANRIKH